MKKVVDSFREIPKISTAFTVEGWAYIHTQIKTQLHTTLNTIEYTHTNKHTHIICTHVLHIQHVMGFANFSAPLSILNKASLATTFKGAS
jgi:hypothetical protein